MLPRFREEKAAELACLFLGRHGGEMSHLKLLKLMYLAERLALLRHGWSITFDRVVSMDHGPVLSRTYNLISNEPFPGRLSVFRDRIAVSKPHHVKLTDATTPEHSPLSRAEIDLMNEVYDKFGSRSRWELRDYTHTLPEWEDPAGSSTPIPLRRILERNGKIEPEVNAILEELGAIAQMECILDA